MSTRVPNRVQVVSPVVVQRTAERMLDDSMPPFMGYFSYVGELYRRHCEASATESVIDATIAAARKRAAAERSDMRRAVRELFG